jgi:hypothetical protein
MIPINSFDNPSVISIQGVRNRLLIRIALFGVLIAVLIYLVYEIFKSKALEKVSDDVYRLINAFANPPSDIKTDKDSNKIG